MQAIAIAVMLSLAFSNAFTSIVFQGETVGSKDHNPNPDGCFFRPTTEFPIEGQTIKQHVHFMNAKAHFIHEANEAVGNALIMVIGNPHHNCFLG